MHSNERILALRSMYKTFCWHCSYIGSCTFPWNEKNGFKCILWRTVSSIAAVAVAIPRPMPASDRPFALRPKKNRSEKWTAAAPKIPSRSSSTPEHNLGSAGTKTIHPFFFHCWHGAKKGEQKRILQRMPCRRNGFSQRHARASRCVGWSGSRKYSCTWPTSKKCFDVLYFQRAANLVGIHMLVDGLSLSHQRFATVATRISACHRSSHASNQWRNQKWFLGRNWWNTKIVTHQGNQHPCGRRWNQIVNGSKGICRLEMLFPLLQCCFRWPHQPIKARTHQLSTHRQMATPWPRQFDQHPNVFAWSRWENRTRKSGNTTGLELERNDSERRGRSVFERRTTVAKHPVWSNALLGKQWPHRSRSRVLVCSALSENYGYAATVQSVLQDLLDPRRGNPLDWHRPGAEHKTLAGRQRLQRRSVSVFGHHAADGGVFTWGHSSCLSVHGCWNRKPHCIECSYLLLATNETLQCCCGQ